MLRESWLQPKSSSMLGIDICSSAVTVLGMSFQAGQFFVQGYHSVSLSDVLTDSDEVSFSIQKAISNAGLQGKLASIAISDSEAISRIFSFSQTLNESEIAAFIKMEIDAYPPFPLQNINWDFKVLGPSLVDAGLQDIQVVACPVELIDARIAVVQKAGLKVHAVDLESLALDRCRQWLNKTWSLKDKHSVLASIAKDERLAYSIEATAACEHNLPSLGLVCGLALRRAFSSL